MEHIPSWLFNSLIYLGAAVLAVPVSKALGLGSIIGYLAAGMLMGPWGLGLVTRVEDILHFAEFGVVLMLFLVGLELQPRRLWQLRRSIFGWGMVQVLGSAAVMVAAAMALGWPLTWAVVGALGFALSSTAIALQVMGERNFTQTPAGQASFSILLFQDMAAIPILALLPLLAAQGGQGALQTPWAHGLEVLRIVGLMALVLLGGRLLLRPALRWIARSRTPEIFTAASLLLVVAIAALMQVMGLTMGLGAFLAGVLLADSEYRHELETDIEPFKGLLLGLFFMAVGMNIDFAVLLQSPMQVVALVAVFMALKALVLVLLARRVGLPYQERPLFVLLLAQGGEFAFVVFQAAGAAQAIPAELVSLFIGAIAVSMLLTPLLLVALDRWVLPRYMRAAQPSMKEIDEPQDAKVILAGFGRYGQIIGRLLTAQGQTVTILEHDAEMVEVARRFGYEVFYGDASRLDLLRVAGAQEAQLLIVAVDDVDQSLAIVDRAQAHFPQLQIIARARDVTHWNQLRDRGLQWVQRELFESSLSSGQQALELLGSSAAQAERMVDAFRTHNLDLLEQMRPHSKDQKRLIAVAKEGRQQLEQQMARERVMQQDGSAGGHTENTP